MIERIHRTVFVKRRALYSPCLACALPPGQRDTSHECYSLYRYLLEIIWDDRLPYVMVIGLNPSTADHIKNDPTLERCERYAKSWGCGGLLMTNLFAARETDPVLMKTWIDPVGEENTIDFFKEQADRAKFVIAAWGNHGSWKDRDREVKAALKLDCLKISEKTRAPYHPLYLNKELRPIPFNY